MPAALIILPDFVAIMPMLIHKGKINFYLRANFIGSRFTQNEWRSNISRSEETRRKEPAKDNAVAARLFKAQELGHAVIQSP